MKLNSILFKLSSTGISLILLMAIVLSGNFFMLIKNSKEADSIYALSLKIKNGILELRKNEKDFLLSDLSSSDFFKTGKTKNIRKHKENVDDLKNKINELIKILPEDKKVVGRRLEKGLLEYEKSFLDLVKGYKDLGFKDWGIVGDWRSAVHLLQESFKSKGDKDLNILVLEMRRSEKDFLLRSDLKYVKKVKNYLKKLKNSSSGEELEFVNGYENSFDGFLNLKKEIGLNKDQGLRLKMRSDVEKLTPVTEEISDFASRYRSKITSKSKNITIAVILTLLLVSTIIYFYFSKAFVNAILSSVKMSKKMSEGDFINEIESKRKDELGSLTNSMNKMSQSLSVLIGNIKTSAEKLGISAHEINDSVIEISKNSDLSADKTNMVTNNIKELKENMLSIASAVEQASVNIESVASSSEQIDLAIEEVAKNAEETKSAAEEAVDNSKQTFSKMEKLGSAAEKISRFTFLIQEISEQTSLLALNATIEAARAGEAGKGFAVVADEIKNLANQTAGATSDITSQVDEIQTASNELIIDVKHIISTMENLESYFSSIAAAVEEQSLTSREISQNVVQASEGIKEINTNVAKTSGVYEDITVEISEVNSFSSEVNKLALDLKNSSDNLEKLSIDLGERTMNFKIKD